MKVSKHLIKDFIPEYPEIGEVVGYTGVSASSTLEDRESGFEYDIARLKEFQDNRLGVSEEVSNIPGVLLKHQRITSRYFSPHTPYNSGLIFHGLGAGKTCEGIAIEELTHSIKPRQKPALVFVKSKELKRAWINELATVCTTDKYIPKYTDIELRRGIAETEEVIARRVKKQVLKHYELETYQTFLMNLPKDTNSPKWDLIIKKYSDRNIILDEAHIIRILAISAETKTIYEQMWNFLHKLRDVNVFLFTGTPIWDKVSEIASLMNLILPETKQLPTGRAFNKHFFDKQGQIINYDELIDAFRGKISYLRSMETSSDKKEIGVSAPWFEHLVVYPDVMSKEQASLVKSISNVNNSKKELEGFLLGARSASNIIIPKDGEFIYGIQIYDYLKKNRKILEEVVDNLSVYSAKIKKIVDLVEDNPNELVYIYTGGFVQDGALTLGLIFSKLGYKWVKNPQLPQKYNDHKSFAVLSSHEESINSDTQITEFVKNFNNPNNKYGDKCRIIIGSEKISVGYSFFNIRQVHVLSPYWNMSENDQAIARALRLGGHRALPKDERVVKIYRHISVERGDVKLSTPKVSVSKNKTPDIHVYKIAEKKDLENSQIYRLIKEISYDCALTYKRNVLEQDKNGSRECNYRDCNYTCHGFPEEYIVKEGKVWDYNIPYNNIIKSNYRLFYSKDEINKIIAFLKNTFRTYSSLTYEQLLELTAEYDKVLVLDALNIIISEKIILNNGYGFKCYLKEKNNIYFLDNDLSSNVYYVNSEYTRNPFITSSSTLEEVNEYVFLIEDRPLIDRFFSNPNTVDWEVLSYKTKILIAEVVFTYLITKRNIRNVKKCTDVVDLVKDNFLKDLYELDVDGHKKYVHVLYTSEYTGISYNVSNRQLLVTGMMRIFNKMTNNWGFVTDPKEEEQLLEQIQNARKKAKSDLFENNPYDMYGTLLKTDNLFRIHIKAKKGEASKSGRACHTYDKLQLVDILMDRLKYKVSLTELTNSGLNIDYNSPTAIKKYIRKETDINKFSFKDKLKDYTIEQLRTVAYILSMSKRQICNIIQTIMEEKNIYHII